MGVRHEGRPGGKRSFVSVVVGGPKTLADASPWKTALQSRALTCTVSLRPPLTDKTKWLLSPCTAEDPEGYVSNLHSPKRAEPPPAPRVLIPGSAF